MKTATKHKFDINVVINIHLHKLKDHKFHFWFKLNISIKFPPKFQCKFNNRNVSFIISLYSHSDICVPIPNSLTVQIMALNKLERAASHSNICMQFLTKSDTTIRPLLKTATDHGFLNSPILLPFVPNLPRNFPFSLNTCIL